MSELARRARYEHARRARAGRLAGQGGRTVVAGGGIGRRVPRHAVARRGGARAKGQWRALTLVWVGVRVLLQLLLARAHKSLDVHLALHAPVGLELGAQLGPLLDPEVSVYRPIHQQLEAVAVQLLHAHDVRDALPSPRRHGAPTTTPAPHRPRHVAAKFSLEIRIPCRRRQGRRPRPPRTTTYTGMRHAGTPQPRRATPRVIFSRASASSASSRTNHVPRTAPPYARRGGANRMACCRASSCAA